MKLCKYKDVLGKPNEGGHKYRFMNLAIVDMGLTIIASAAIAYYLTPKNTGIQISAEKGVTMGGGLDVDTFLRKFIIIFLILNVIGFALHWFFCVETTLVKAFRTMYGKSAAFIDPKNVHQVTKTLNNLFLKRDLVS